MSYKYNISNLIKNKLKEDESDKEDNPTDNVKGMSDSTNDTSSLKNKSLNEVLEDVKKIETEYSTKDYIDAPEELNLSKVDVPNKSEEELVEIAKNSLSKKYSTSKDTTNKSFENKINNLINEQETYKTNASKQQESINNIYNEATKETEDQALKRGLARSSIIINKLSNLNNNKATELISVMQNLQSNLDNNLNEIAKLEEEKISALNNLDIEYAIELNQKIEDIKSDYNKQVKDAIDFNNEIEKLQAEYKLDLDKQKLDKQESITKLEKEYNVDFLNKEISKKKFEYLQNYFDSLDKDYAISLFLTNKELKSVLGEDYSKLYKHLKNR